MLQGIKDNLRSLFAKYNNFSIEYLSVLERMNIATAKGAIGQSLRQIDETNPLSWEFSGFSQNLEDGIIQYLTSKVLDPNRYFIEIGSSDGLENNSAFLAFVLKFSGVMVEGNSYKSSIAEQSLQRFNWGVKYVNAFVSAENIEALLKENAILKDPDFFSLDIDGNDYYILKALFDSGYKPRVVCVEYNSSYGPEAAITIKYNPSFNYWTAHETHWYYGVSVAGWRKLLDEYGYKFITVDSNGVNAFFVDPLAFSPDFLQSIKGINFRENFAVRSRTKTTWDKQFEKIKHLDYYNI